MAGSILTKEFVKDHKRNLAADDPNTSIFLDNLPYKFYKGSAIVYNDEIHILGGDGFDHYKWVLSDGVGEWIQLDNLPTNYSSSEGAVVVYHDEIHLLKRTYHYKWDGDEWTELDNLPYQFYNGSAVVYNDEIHILGSLTSAYRRSHYKWDGTQWTSASTLPYDFNEGSAVVYKGEIHILGGYERQLETYGLKNHYKWDGFTWSESISLYRNYYGGAAVVYNDEIHLLSNLEATDYNQEHYVLGSLNWSLANELPGSTIYDGSAVVYNNEIHIFNYDKEHYTLNSIWEFEAKTLRTYAEGAVLAYHNDNLYAFIYFYNENTDSASTQVYRWDNTTHKWISRVSKKDVEIGSSYGVSFNNKIYMIDKSECVSYDSEEVQLNVSTFPFNKKPSTVVFNNEVHVFLGDDREHYRSVTPEDSTSWEQASTPPSTFDSFTGCGAVVYNNEVHIIGGGSNKIQHVKWDGSKWSSLSNLPYEIINPVATVTYNHEIHIFGGNKNKKHVKWDGKQWSYVSQLPMGDVDPDTVCVGDNMIHLMSILTGNNDKVYSWYYRSYADYKPVSDAWLKKREVLDPIVTLPTNERTVIFHGDDYSGSRYFTIYCPHGIYTMDVFFNDRAGVYYPPMVPNGYGPLKQFHVEFTGNHADEFKLKVVSMGSNSDPEAYVYEGSLTESKNLVNGQIYSYVPKKIKAGWVLDNEGTPKQVLKKHYRISAYKPLSFMQAFYKYSEITYDALGYSSSDNTKYTAMPYKSSVFARDDLMYIFGTEYFISKVVRLWVDDFGTASISSIDDIKNLADLTLKRTSSADFNLSGCCVLLDEDNDYVYFLGGGTTSTTAKYCYRFQSYILDWSGSTEVILSSNGTLPIEFINGSAVIYHDKIHIIGGETASGVLYRKHYYRPLNGSTWTEVNTTSAVLGGGTIQIGDSPSSPAVIGSKGSAVVYKDKIYYVGKTSTDSEYPDYMYVYSDSDGASRKSYNVPSRSLVVWKDHLFAIGEYGRLYMYNEDNNTWTKFNTTLKYSTDFQVDSYFVYNDSLYMLGSYGSVTATSGRGSSNVYRNLNDFYSGKHIVYYGYRFDDFEETLSATDEILDNFTPVAYFALNDEEETIDLGDIEVEDHA